MKKQEGGKKRPLAFYNRQSKQHVKDKNYKIERGAVMKKQEIRSAVKTVYQELWDLLSLDVETEHFFKLPKGAEPVEDSEEDEGWNYAYKKINEIRGHVRVLFLGEEKIIRSLDQIVEEVKYFIKNCEVPGVVTRWKRINPILVYFDCAFEVMETCPEAYLEMRRGLTDTRLSCYPDAELIENRKAYFAEAKAKCEHDVIEYSQEQVFQEEILHTLTLLFEDAFWEYL